MSRLMQAALIFSILTLHTHEPAHAQAFTEFRDPLRGVTFYSVQISSDPLTELQGAGSQFGEEDKMTLGLSAFFFDESDVVDDYVLWLRHDGPRQWFTGNNPQPLRTVIDGEPMDFSPLHATKPGMALGAGPFVEKLEFEFLPPEFHALAKSDSVTLELTTLLGVVEKSLSNTELEAIRSFDRRVRQRHEEAMTSLSEKGGD